MGLVRSQECLQDLTLRGYVTATIPVTNFRFCHPVQVDECKRLFPLQIGERTVLACLLVMGHSSSVWWGVQ